ncbi:uncharacterized protein HGUI_00371 [Hanseniaspora guilliermondii]|uniref:Maf-like protein YOR111W n=1 Tax=Hanseniaspora guilliermondii TaxID=56406 RepID=A0A1L0AZN5_9ASCO|nr:uncharacterized protein HGUI_00371 [Hanseniaspora guilliermondii]
MVTTYLYLNSTSPRRVGIINKIKKFLPNDITFDVNKPLFQEDLNKENYKSSRDYLIDNCKLKTCTKTIESCFEKTGRVHSNEPFQVIIVSADTILTDKHEMRVLEKPIDKSHNLNMLQTQIQDGSVKCLTSVHISKYAMDKKTKQIQCLKSDQFVSEAEIVLDKAVLDTKMLDIYVDIGEGLDAAGGFKIQENGSFMVKQIVGDYYNVVGLPFNETLMTLYNYI